MPDSPSAILWTFVAGLLAVIVVLAAFGAAIVIYQRRFMKMHRAYAQQLLQAQEEERAWVAREVHDDALQRLAVIHQVVESVKAEAPGLTNQQAHRVGAIQEEIKDLAVVLRGLAHRLHPALIEKVGLPAALEGLCADVACGYGLKVEASIGPSLGSLDPPRALAMYRIAQEALRNVATHSGVRTATLAYSENGTGAELVVSDQGKGFATGVRAGGLGVISMRERANLAGGAVVVTSSPGKGTSIRATLPTAPGRSA